MSILSLQAFITIDIYCAGNSTQLQYKVNEGSYELPLFKPPLCKVADAECNVSV